MTMQTDTHDQRYMKRRLWSFVAVVFLAGLLLSGGCQSREMAIAATGRSQADSPRQAGLQAVGQALKSLDGQPPCLVLVYTSIPSADADVIAGGLEALAAAPKAKDAQMVTITTYKAHTIDRQVPADAQGVSAVALGGDGLQVDVLWQDNVLSNLSQAGKDLGRRLANLRPKAVILLAEDTVSHPWQANRQGVIEDLLTSLGRELGPTPAIGGMAHGGSSGSAVYVGDTRISQGIVGIALSGQIEIGLAVTNGYRSIAGPYRVTAVRDPSTLLELDGSEAMDVYRKVLTQLPEAKDRVQSNVSRIANISLLRDGRILPTYAHVTEDGKAFHRFPQRFRQGDQVVISQKDTSRHIESAGRAAQEAIDQLPEGSKPFCLLNFYCIGRAEQIPEQLQQVRDVVGPDLPSATAFCAGEIGPERLDAPTPGIRYYQYTATTLVLGN